jgi:hypothetical protein
VLPLLGYPDPRVRRAIARALAAVADDPPVQLALLPLLTDPDRGVRGTAAWALCSQVAVPRVQQTLWPLLADPDPDVRPAAARAWGPRSKLRRGPTSARRPNRDATPVTTNALTMIPSTELRPAISRVSRLHRSWTSQMFWDGVPAYHEAAVKRFLAGTRRGQIHLEQVPAYAPDLNPAEGVWEQLKYVEWRKVACHDQAELRQELRRAIARLRHKPHLVRGFIKHAGY